MKNFITRVWDTISYPFIMCEILIDESRTENLDGKWDKYHARKNCRAELRELKAEYKQNRKNIKHRWEI